MRYFTLQQAAHEVRTSTTALFRAIRAGQLHAIPDSPIDNRRGSDEMIVGQDCLESWTEGRPCPHANDLGTT